MNKGFSLIEFLIVLVILTIINNLYIKKIDFRQINDKSNLYEIELKLLDYKTYALIKREKTCLKDKLIISNYELCFNERANVNMAQSIKILNSNKVIVIHLGAGVYEIK